MKTVIDRMKLRVVQVTKAGRPYMDIADLLKREVNRLEKSKRTGGTRNRIFAAVPARQKEDKPVHEWQLADALELDDWSHSYQTVGQFMSTDLFTLRPYDLLDFAASVMDWWHMRHVPIEDDDGYLGVN